MKMNTMHRWVRRMSGAQTQTDAPGLISKDQRTRTTRTMSQTLAFGLEVRDSELNIVEHCSLVAELCERLGRLMRISEADAYILETAARIHEIGMFTIPATLLKRAAPLSPEELARVRSQAQISAQIAATMHHPRVVELIEHQYDDYTELAGKMDERNLLLAGILRVADIIAAVTRPRPYTAGLPWEMRAQLLQSGAGTRFHPAAVRCALQMPAEA